MGVQITISGKLRGDRSAFEKHTQGILPRAGNYAKNIVTEDIVHTQTPMGLIGIKIRIARKEKLVPEFMRKEEQNDVSNTTEEKSKEELDVKTESEQIKIEVGAAIDELDTPPDDYAVRGRDLMTGIPKEIYVSYKEIAHSLDK